MNKQKIKVLINPLCNLDAAPVNIVELNDVFDFIGAKFDIDSISIQLNEKKKPSEFYFSMLSNLCKINCKKVIVENYVGSKKNTTLTLDSFSLMNLIIDNLNGYTVMYNNEKHSFKDLQALQTILDLL